MLRPEQEKWINHLSDTDSICIFDFDPNAEAIFQKVKAKIDDILGPKHRLLHRGATALKISGQDEIDAYIPVLPSDFNKIVDILSKTFGKPGSLYELERARFKLFQDQKRVDIFVINQEHRGWIDGEKFYQHLLSHPKYLEKYKVLKESGNGLSTREYYRRKIEFINAIINY